MTTPSEGLGETPTPITDAAKFNGEDVSFWRRPVVYADEMAALERRCRALEEEISVAQYAIKRAIFETLNRQVGAITISENAWEGLRIYIESARKALEAGNPHKSDKDAA